MHTCIPTIRCGHEGGCSHLVRSGGRSFHSGEVNLSVFHPIAPDISSHLIAMPCNAVAFTGRKRCKRRSMACRQGSSSINSDGIGAWSISMQRAASFHSGSQRKGSNQGMEGMNGRQIESETTALWKSFRTLPARSSTVILAYPAFRPTTMAT